jgi:glycosyltransferase involved in cell wall biosynthesis
MSTPLLILSDAPTAGSGLGRITKDLATRIHTNMQDVFRVGTLGYAGPYSRALGFPQYTMDMKDWIVYNLPEVWDDLAGNEKGVILTIWDASRMLWFSRPENCGDPQLRKFLESKRFERYGYFPIDATGPNDKLTAVLRHIIEGYDRVLAYSAWAQGILKRTCPTLDIDQLPHGIQTEVFFPRPRVQARHSFGAKLGAKQVKGKNIGQYVSVPDNAFLIGIVGTNQIRKDWGLGISTVAELAKERNVMVWIHTDILERHWSIPALLNDFGLLDKAVVATVQYPDETMAWAYSACDVTLGIGLGEGFGYPIFESLACGTPCVHGDYGGAAEHLPPEMLVNADAERIEGPYNCVRRVYGRYEWLEKIKDLPLKGGGSLLPSHLDWKELWPRWEQWLRAGIRGGTNLEDQQWIREHANDPITNPMPLLNVPKPLSEKLP